MLFKNNKTLTELVLNSRKKKLKLIDREDLQV